MSRRLGCAGTASVAGLILAAVMGSAQTSTSPAPSIAQPAPPQGAATQPSAAPQNQPAAQPSANGQRDLPSQLGSIGPGLSTSVWQWKGLIVEKIEFEGVPFDKEDKLPNQLEQRVGEPLDPVK